MFWVLIRDGSFEYPQHMFWLRNKKITFSYALLSGGLIIRTINGFEKVLLVVNISYFLEEKTLL